MSQIDRTKLSPMMVQYMEIKDQHKDQVLFFRLGDFYEMFFDDAICVSKELELTLTGRDCGLGERAPMCGVPHHSAEGYIAKLIKKGFKVAVCEQVENPAETKGMVRREVVRVMTPGTLIESSILEDGNNNFICSIYADGDGFGLSFCDVSTGEINLTEINSSDQVAVMNQIGKYQPKEIIFNKGFLNCQETAGYIKEKLCSTVDLFDDDFYNITSASTLLLKQFDVLTLKELGIDQMTRGICSLGGLISYVGQTQRVGLERIKYINIYDQHEHMLLDVTARKNLEITQTMRSGEKKGSLLWVLDKTKTSMGKRMMKSIVEQPVTSVAVIEQRLNAVDELIKDSLWIQDIAGNLKNVYDIERLMTRIIYGNATPREVMALGETFGKLPELRSLLEDATCQKLQGIFTEIDTMDDMHTLICEAVVEDPPISLKDGKVFKTGYHTELDELRYVCENTAEIMAGIEQNERERTGIKNLKIGYNKVFGYYLEITKAYIDKAPPEYIRKQTLTGCERYITQELKELESKMMNAKQQILEIETSLFDKLRGDIGKELDRIQKTAHNIAVLDVLVSFAYVTLTNNYNRPTVDLSDDIIIEDGRHPVVEHLTKECDFVPNDVNLNGKGNKIAIITGPNMAGKSTYMRQVALITLMAQIGCFVPAKTAKIGIVDGIFTRVGASDDLSTGQSTFMVEMTELAQILKSATKKSLLILDEIGRGTSTYDGMSIARSVVEYIADDKKLGAKTLFATHYHELSQLEENFDCVKNYNIAVKKRGEDIIFLRRILPGGVDQSFGIEVSKLAGIPQWIVKRAFKVLEELEAGKEVTGTKPKVSHKQVHEPEQIFFVDEKIEQAKRRIKGANIDEMRGIDALNLLYELQELFK